MQTTEPTTAHTSEVLDTEMKEVEASADAEWSAAQALAEGDSQVNHQLRRLSLQGEASQGPLEDEDALLTPGEHLIMHWFSIHVTRNILAKHSDTCHMCYGASLAGTLADTQGV